MYRRILVPIDGSDCAKAGLRELTRLGDPQTTQVLLIHVVNEARWDQEFPTGTVGAIMQESPHKDASDLLLSAQKTVQQWGISCQVMLAEAQGQSTAQVIVAQATRWNAELILMGTHGRRAVSHLILGSDAAEVVSAAWTPVLLVRHMPSHEQPLRRNPR